MWTCGKPPKKYPQILRRRQFFKDQNITHGHPKYDTWEHVAKTIKISIQMWIGVMLITLLVTKFFFQLIQQDYPSWLVYIEGIHSMHTLEIVSRALAYSAGVELAYMLFTPGPDEAIEPLITGAASALLYLISRSSRLDLETVSSMLLFVLVIASLFFVKELFVEFKKDNGKSIIDRLWGTPPRQGPP